MNFDIAIRSVLALFFLWIVVNYLWPDFRCDAFREDIFSVRDEMFLYAVQGNISFDHPAYTTLRNRMNTILRHAHEFTLTRLVLVLLTRDNQKNEEIVRWEKAVNDLPADTQAKMKDFNLRFAIFVLQHLFYYSFFRYMIFRPLMLFVNVRVREVIASPKVASGVEQLESKTLDEEDRLTVTTA